MFAILGPALPHVHAGKLKLLATSGPERSASTPDVPTVAEAALPGYAADEWWGVVAPQGPPPDIIDKWNVAIRDSVNTGSEERPLGTDCVSTWRSRRATFY